MSQAESDARDALKKMGAISVLDSAGVHCATLMMFTPEVANNLDEAIGHVGNLPYLTHLELTDLQVTDEHMKTIKKLKKLISLVLSGTQITDEGLKLLAGSKVDTLYIDNTQLSAAATDILAQMKAMKILDISGLDVTSNLTPLQQLENLEWLVLEDATLDASAIDALSKLPALGRLTINGSTVSDADLARLKSAKPSLMIDRATAEEGAEAVQDNAASTGN